MTGRGSAVRYGAAPWHSVTAARGGYGSQEQRGAVTSVMGDFLGNKHSKPKRFYARAWVWDLKYECLGG